MSVQNTKLKGFEQNVCVCVYHCLRVCVCAFVVRACEHVGVPVCLYVWL